MAPVEAKVSASTAAAAVAGLTIYLLQRFVFHGDVDPVLASWIYTLTPAVLAFAAGYMAKHTPRPATVAPVEPSNVVVKP
jgi:hypothetical protein